jgi:FtsZ-interacting cell division protein ZipA
MMDFARELARRLDGYLLDEQGGTLSIQRERYMREEIIQFEHQELS